MKLDEMTITVAFSETDRSLMRAMTAACQALAEMRASQMGVDAAAAGPPPDEADGEAAPGRECQQENQPLQPPPAWPKDVPTPLEQVIDDLGADQAHADVVRHLIHPLVKHGLKVTGNEREVITRCAREFRKVAKRKLEFAARHIMRAGGRHKLFPENSEIYAALGHYEAHGQTAGDLPLEQGTQANGAHA